MNNVSELLLDVRSLRVEYNTSRGLFAESRPALRVLDNFNLEVPKGETLGIVGESGCGKTSLAQTIARFVPASGGEIIFEGENVLEFDKASMRKYRKDMQLVFQNPMSSLNPRMKVRSIVGEPLVTHTNLDRTRRIARVSKLLEETGLQSDYMDRYPNELSGGQAQRVVLARALALNPKLLLLDEPTSALDVSVQAQILNLLKKLQGDHNLTYMIISHSLTVVEHISDRIAVLYLGEIVEQGPCGSVFDKPSHPYTQALFSSTPIPDPNHQRQRVNLIGTVPNIAKPPSGCRFHTRCPEAMEICHKVKPQTHTIADQHTSACHLLADSH